MQDLVQSSAFPFVAGGLIIFILLALWALRRSGKRHVHAKEVAPGAEAEAPPA